MASTYKLVFVGPVRAGKTTAIRTLSDIEVVSTEAAASDDLRILKAQTTVAMDYGVLELGGGNRVRLYGTPGQDRFDFMWEILSRNALGVVLLLDAESEDPLVDLRGYVQAFRGIIDRSALVVGITHSSSAAERTLRPAVMRALDELGVPTAVMNVDARVRSDMTTLVKTLIYSLDPEVDSEAS